jgi:2,5-furandicarboxylate decarboxylase 1
VPGCQHQPGRLLLAACHRPDSQGNPDDGRKAIEAAHRGHSSCKHIFVVDEDIDIYDPLSVEWAMATRFQADRDLVMLGRERGSSLDPSAQPGTYETCKVGFDLTAPLGSGGKPFSKVPFPAGGSPDPTCG